METNAHGQDSADGQAVKPSGAESDHTFSLYHDRGELLRLLPQRTVVAEIGVATGALSQQILARTGPKQLHLIVPW